MSTCPACGVAVVPGYVKCPKCGAGLPRTKTQTQAGGTAVEPSGSSRSLAFALGAGLVIAVAVIVIFARKGHDTRPANATPAPVEAPAVTAPVPPPQIAAPLTTSLPTPSTAVDPQDAARTFADLLKKQRLWGTASVAGTQLVVRSGGCDDAAMAPLVGSQTAQLRAAGLTKLRCLSQSGGVVFERDL